MMPSSGLKNFVFTSHSCNCKSGKPANGVCQFVKNKIENLFISLY